ncbi:heavy metal translocating P-type ATPase [Pseudahrensia aquimaris]|uniref:Heavy metal translocating P-type ATPase n=1 Tax=Pseudahrensia aquimaris TaxID=744461 RepID=A0ABW3FJK1_9HYPH
MTCCSVPLTSDQGTGEHRTAQAHLASEEIRLAARSLGNGLLQTDFIVPEMHCVACISKIEKSLAKLPQVEQARANLSNRRVSIVWNPDRGDALALDQTLDGLGFDHTLYSGDEPENDTVSAKGRQLLMSLAVAGFASANIMLLSVSVWSGADAETAKLFHLISGMIAVPAVAYAGRPFFSSALKALSAGRLNMDVPISLAVLLALLMGLYESLGDGQEAYFDACVMLLFFLLIGRYLDHMMRERARGSVESLAKLTARGGVVVGNDGELSYLPQSALQPGQRLRIMPGERFPVDGTIVEGATDIDRSLVTGESDGCLASVGETIEAGVLNLTRPIDIIATSDASNSFLAEMMQMMEAAQNGRGRYVRVAERMATIYAPAVHLLALVTFVGWLVATGGDWKASLYCAIAVLIITCPCALGLAVPVVHVIGAGRLLKEGIFMRDGSAFERMAEIDRVAFDKTGTLTLGTPCLTKATDVTKNDGKIIAALAARSSHPVANALCVHFSDQQTVELDDIEEIAGFGLQAHIDGKTVRLGRPEWVVEISQGDSIDETATSAFCIEGEAPALFYLTDKIRSGARETVDALKAHNLSVEILSGDRAANVAPVAAQLGIPDYQAQLTPKGKLDHLAGLSSRGNKVLMLGDGLNDAPSLAAAHVSMAPASASEIGRLASDFVFLRKDLSAVPFAHTVSLKTRRLIQQNFGIALAYNCISVPLAMAGHVTPLIAAIAMSASSIVVVANSMRLNWVAGAMTAEAGSEVAPVPPSNSVGLSPKQAVS